MAAPDKVTLTPGLSTDFSIAENSPHVVVYHFWTQAPGSPTWKQFGEGTTSDDKLDHFIIADPIPTGTIFAYVLAVGGNANTPWSTTISIKQPGAPNSGATWTESGVTSDDGDKLGHQTLKGQVTLV